VYIDADSTEMPVPIRVEHRCRLENAVVESRRYFWSKPVEMTLHAMSEHLVINMALTPRPAHTRLERIRGGCETKGEDAGRLLVMIPGVPFHLVAPSGSFRSLFCAISCSRFETLVGDRIDWETLSPFGGELRSGFGIESHLTRIHDELVRDRIGRRDMIDAALEMICIEMTRRFRQGSPSRPDFHVGGLSAWRTRAIMNRVNAEQPAPQVAELARICGLTERQLSRAFKAETGLTIGRFVAEVTMERAHRLLTTTKLSVTEIALMLGFASADSFAQAFRRLTGTTPSRARHR